MNDRDRLMVTIYRLCENEPLGNVDAKKVQDALKWDDKKFEDAITGLAMKHLLASEGEAGTLMLSPSGEYEARRLLR
jgi:hypothetical protein